MIIDRRVKSNFEILDLLHWKAEEKTYLISKMDKGFVFTCLNDGLSHHEKIDDLEEAINSFFGEIPYDTYKSYSIKIRS